MYEMIDMHSKYDNMHNNGIFYALICINNHIIKCINYMLSTINFPFHMVLEKFSFMKKTTLESLMFAPHDMSSILPPLCALCTIFPLSCNCRDIIFDKFIEF